MNQASGADAEEIVDDAMSRIMRTLTRERVRRSRMASSSELSSTDMWLLMHIDERAGARITDLAAWQDVDKSTMTVQVRRLVAAGLAERARDALDRRAVRVTLTDYGREVLLENRQQARQFLARLIGSWTADERDELVRSVTHLADALDSALAGS